MVLPLIHLFFNIIIFKPKKFNEKKIKKKDLIHPRSRKADQVNRAKLRKVKLEEAHEKLMLRKNTTGIKFENFMGFNHYLLFLSFSFELVSRNIEGI